MTQDTQQSPSQVVARGANYYRMTRYIMAAMLIGMGAWFAYDGWIGWPHQNAEFARLSKEIDATEDATRKTELIDERKQYSEHGPWDIFFQKMLAVALPPLGVFTLFWALRNSRGEFRLSGQTLDVPGHGAVGFDQIRRLDKKLWDRKGIAYIDYEPAGGGDLRRFKLDDFVYERKPIDQIYDAIDQYVTPPPTADESPELPAEDSEDPSQNA